MDDVLGYGSKRAIVTGCASGTGEAAARILIDLGAEVHGIDVKEPSLTGLAGYQATDLREPDQGFFDNFPKPIGRNARPEEQGWALVLVNSPRASYLTGQNIFVDGGFMAGMQTGQIDPAALQPAGGQDA
jgi:NAD(P)-dependent dehydrogenase (short-subunit alcohol dehydrogenase family)